MLLSCVCSRLWFQREALEELLFTLVAEQLILTSGSTRWLTRADAEVRAAVETLSNGEILRSVDVEQLADTLELDRDSTLAQLADAAADPWSTLLGEHRIALRTLSVDVHGVADENRRLLDAGDWAVRDTLERIGASDIDTMDMAMRLSAANVNYQALQTTANIRQISLLNFLK